MNNHKRSLRIHGFTMIELLLASAIFSVIVGIVSIFVVYVFGNYSFSFEENRQINLAQGTLTRLVREVREARLADNGAWAIVECEAESFIFYSDITNDGRPERIRYFVDGTELKRGVVEPTPVPVIYPLGTETVTTVISDLSTVGGIFTYFNGDYPADVVNNPLDTTDCLLDTRYVEIRVEINISEDFLAEPFELVTGVAIRSLKDNLDT